MARVRFLQAVGGVDFAYVAGQEVDMPGEEASNWCLGDRAEMVRGDAPETPERAPQPEKTTKARSTRATKPAADGA
jgi:hypothetical protein